MSSEMAAFSVALSLLERLVMRDTNGLVLYKKRAPSSLPSFRDSLLT
jgi:hypothetical protein